jgi:hypothetical protein
MRFLYADVCKRSCTCNALHGSYQEYGHACRAFVFGDEWIEFDSEWTTQPQIKQFWVNVFAWVAPQGCALQPQ